MSKAYKEELHDKHIIDALNKLPIKMINNEGNYVSIRINAPRGETGQEHIAKKFHGLYKKDIELIQEALRNPFKVKPDKRKNRKNYFCKVYDANIHTCF